ncbi:unnamed protein product [Spirodela intermedia]|uniref:J domain-containing protein n=1 Tax=Spirodela intermedia TaxID=51605 RepID=A0A7I8L5I3_SPIIN|nr:unnamed protein product [Spirodela intermedia]
MSTGVIGRSSCRTSVLNSELHQIRGERGGGARQVSASVRICGVRPGNGWGKLRVAAPLSSSSSSSSSGRLFVSCVRARAAVGDGVTAVATGKSFYELLGIPQGGSVAEIKRAYKEMARRYHPDVCPNPDRTEEYTRLFIVVQEAYETLSDPGRRARYDRDLAHGFHLNFSARRRSYRYSGDEVMEEKSQWRNQWQDQLEGLKRRSMSRHPRKDFSWGARMRRQQQEPPSE